MLKKISLFITLVFTCSPTLLISQNQEIPSHTKINDVHQPQETFSGKKKLFLAMGAALVLSLPFLYRSKRRSDETSKSFEQMLKDLNKDTYSKITSDTFPFIEKDSRGSRYIQITDNNNIVHSILFYSKNTDINRWWLERYELSPDKEKIFKLVSDENPPNARSIIVKTRQLIPKPGTHVPNPNERVYIPKSMEIKN